MKKQELRRYYLDERCRLSGKQRTIMDDLMLIQFQRLLISIPENIMTYAPIEKHNEFDPQLITDFCYFKNPNVQLLYPVIDRLDDKDELIAVRVDDDTEFVPGSYGVPEPVDCPDVAYSEIHMVIVPLLAFDVKGFRVGYGKGYYDRFLVHCSSDCIKIGFSYFEPVAAIEDCNSQDIPLDYCITHEKIYAF